MATEPRQTLEQQRAQNAWECAIKAQTNLGADYDKYVKLVKSLPALIMNSGLMQVVAFLHEKSLDKKTGQPKPNDHHTWVGTQLRNSIHARFKDVPENFDGFMKYLFKDADAQKFQAINAEAFAWLKWLRQMAAARKAGE